MKQTDRFSGTAACLREGVAAGKDAGESTHRTTHLLT